MNLASEQGNSALLMVMLLFILASGILYQTEVQNRAAQRLVSSQIESIKRFNGAQLALSWGMTLKWLPDRLEWQCQYLPHQGLAACLRIVDEHRALLGGGVLSGSVSQRLFHWQWGRVELTQFYPRPHGWLDFCPLPDILQCESLFS